MDQIARLGSLQPVRSLAKACQDLSRQSFERQRLVSNFNLSENGDKSQFDGHSRGNGGGTRSKEPKPSEKALAAGAS